MEVHESLEPRRSDLISLSDLLQLAGGLSAWLLFTGFLAALASVLLAMGKGMGNRVPSALWLTTPAMVLCFGAWGAELRLLDGQEALATASGVDAAALAGAALHEAVASRVVGRLVGAAALASAAAALAVGFVASQSSPSTREVGRADRPWTELLGATLVLWAAVCTVSGLAMWSELDAAGAASLQLGTRFLGLGSSLGGWFAMGLAGTLLVALAVLHRARLRGRVVVLGLVACLLPGLGWLGAEAVVVSSLARMAQVAAPPQPLPELQTEGAGGESEAPVGDPE